ncbi:MAG: hypothetical protein U0167_03130 [bacterium]
MHERDADPLGKRCESLVEDVDEPDGLEKKAPEIGEDRAGGVRLVVDLPPVAAVAEDAGGYERREFALETRGAHVKMAGQIRHEPPSVGMEKRRGEDPLTNPRKQGVERLRTHDAYSYTRSA